MYYYKITLLVGEKKYQGIRPYSTTHLDNAKAYFRERAIKACGMISRITIEQVHEQSKEVKDYLEKRAKAIKTPGARLH